MRRLTSAALCAAMLLFSWGPSVTSAFAQQVTGKVSGVSVVPQFGLLPSGPGVGLGSPLVNPSISLPLSSPLISLTPSLAAPSINAAVAAPVALKANAVAVKPVAAKPVPHLVLVPSALEAVKPSAPGESFGRAAEEDFAKRLTGENLAAASGDAAGPVGVEAAVLPALQPTLSAPSIGERENGAPKITEPAPPTKPEGEKRGALFPLVLAGLSALAWGGLEFARWSAHALSAQGGAPSAGGTALAVAGIAAMALTGAFVLNVLVDAVVFVAAVWRGRRVSDVDLRAFLRSEVLEGRLDGNAAALVKAYRPDNRYKDFTFAFASRGLIWVRPELAATPWLLRQVLLHELAHMRASAPRGPPRGALRGLLSALGSELRARAAEFKGPGALKKIKVSGLQRALTQTQTSLRLSRPYDVLVLNPDSKELEDPKLYDGLSDGAARVTSLKNDEPQKALAENGVSRFRAIVLGRATKALPEPKSKEDVRLQSVLKQLDSLYVLATRLVVRGDAFNGTTEVGAWTDLVGRAQRLKENGSRRALQAFEGEVRKLWRQIASQRLKGVGVTDLMDGLYGGLRDRGFAFLSFGPDDAGVVSWEKLLRYWESADGGQFRVTRVDLEDGGHLLILRKVEARVGLWLRPIKGGRIAVSVPNASFTEEGRATARKSLEDAGFGQQLELFDKMEVTVRHVFGADVGRQEIYVTVPRRNATAIRKYVSSSAEILDSQSNFEPQLMDSAGLHAVKPVWRIGITGADGSIMWIDTGGDATHEDFGRRLDVVDMVDEGPEDWAAHGTHVAAISISGNDGFPGMARGAKGIMAKVFSRDQAGASDGDIMGSAAVGLKKGVDVISVSLGSRGTSADNLADFFSQLTKQKNVAGEYPIVTASAGNSGPFDKTLSQPAAGVEVIAVAAAAKSKDDGIPEVAFYSSVGPDIDRRYAIKRYRFKPEITAIGGDVTTTAGSSNVYKDGVYAAKSKDAPRSASDLEDGKHTGLSGTSMANPALAGIALLVKLAMRSAGAITPFVAENMAFAVRSVLMRTAKDMGVPLWFQGAGFVDAWAAVSLVAGSGTRALGLGVRNAWRRLTGAAPVPAADAWGWLERLKGVQDAEDRAFREAELAKSEAQAQQEQEGEGPDEASEEPVDRSAMGNVVQAEVVRRFNAARDLEVPALLTALTDGVWLVRMRAAAVLLNLKAPASAAALAEAGLNDPDARVRQMAFLALAELPTHSIDALLRQAASNESWDVGAYAAYALIRRGDRTAIARVVKELSNPDKRARFTSTWLLGQIGSYATAAEAEGLSARVRDRAERGNIRHLAAAALSNLADAVPEAISDRVVTDMLDAAGTENLALTRTIAKVFPIAVRSKAFIARLRSEPLKPIITDFVVKNRDAISKPGALSELVQLLARAADVPLDAPTTPMDSSGSGVSGVDEALGPLDLFVVPPPGGPTSVDAETLKRFETTTKASLPVSRALWLSVPEHKLYALTIALEHRGWTVRRSLPYYPLSNAPAEAGGLTVDLGAAESALPADADMSFVRIRAAAGVSELRVMAALERVAEAAKGKGPVVIALTLAAPTTRRTPLSMLIDRLVASGIGIVVGAGNAGPKTGSVSAPGDSGLAVVVAAASKDGLQYYSSRGTPETPRVTWTDLVDDLQPGEALAQLAATAAEAVAGGPAPVPAKIIGTAVAAERTAAKLAELARLLSEGMTAAGRPLPDGWFLYLTALVKRTATAMPTYGQHEVGAGLFASKDAAVDALRARLHDPEAIVREANALAAEARRRTAPPATPKTPGPGPARRAIRALLGAFLTASPVHAPAKALAEHVAGSQKAPAVDADASWWKDKSATRTAVTVPLYALRPVKKNADPGVGKYSDLGRYYREELAGQGTDAVLLLPHFATTGESPYAPVSLFALNEDQIDWSSVEEVRADPALAARLVAPSQSVDYSALRVREGAVAREAYARFLKAGGPRAADFTAFAAKNADWLDEYAEFMALSSLIGKPALDWTAEDQSGARAKSDFAGLAAVRRWSQWLAHDQLKAALDEVHAAGGKVLFDIPMFRAKNGVDAWKRPELFADLRSRNPGIVNAWVHEDWKDLALWRWSELKKGGYAAALDPYRHWLEFGFDGARADALHFAYKFGNGQLASGDEPGDEYVAALSGVLSARGAFPLAEAFEGKDADARRLGFVTVGGDWKKVSSHDDARSPDFLGRYFAALREPSSGAGAKFVAYALGDEWRDPLGVKEMRDGVSTWRYRIPLPEDADYKDRARSDARPQLRALKAAKDGDVWAAAESVRAAFVAAAGTFVKRDGDSVQIWAASMDWFLEEWGRDTFISLPGLLLSTGRFEDAKSVLRRFAAFEKDGLIPNRINGKDSEYNTADGPMWYVQALKSYAEASGDWAFVDEMAPVARRIMSAYENGASYERYGRKNVIKMDADGLVVTPAQATWMDADPEGRDKPVTPRYGKAVEINALWYANLRFLAELDRRAGDDASAKVRGALADKVKASFNEKFWFESEDNRRAWGGSGGALRDVVEGDPHGDAIRPNMLFAVSKGGDLLSPERRRAVVLAATRDLLTRKGPRTLSDRDSGYRASYDTSKPPLEKDQAYHQGTVWPWLMGAFAEALAQVRRDMGWDEARIGAETRGLITPLVEALASGPEGSLPEVYDGGASDPALKDFSLDDRAGLAPVFKTAGPVQNPGGTRSQAWSVAEILRLLAR